MGGNLDDLVETNAHLTLLRMKMGESHWLGVCNVGGQWLTVKGRESKFTTSRKKTS